MKLWFLLLMPAFLSAQDISPFAAAHSGNLRVLKAHIKNGVSPSAEEDGVPLIFFAKNTKVARFLLEKGAFPFDSQGRTMLMKAASNRDKAMVNFFLRHNSSYAKDSQGWTALHYLAEGPGKASLAAPLIESGLNINAQDSAGWTALMMAAEAGKADLTALLLNHGAKASLTNKEGATALSLVQDLLPYAVDKTPYLKIIALLKAAL